MSRNNFSLNQKKEFLIKTLSHKGFFINKTFINFDVVCYDYGIFRCPICKCFISLGHLCDRGGVSYMGKNNYLEIHKELSFQPLKKEFYELNDIKRIEFDHILPCFHGGINDDENILILCDNCNKTMNSKKYDKEMIINENLFPMEIDCEKKIENGEIIYKDKNKIIAIFDLFHKNKSEERIINMQKTLIFPMEID